eukprot:scaffold6247_cov416-Prasinococcus_capsulatus_cf.AAC.6
MYANPRRREGTDKPELPPRHRSSRQGRGVCSGQARAMHRAPDVPATRGRAGPAARRRLLLMGGADDEGGRAGAAADAAADAQPGAGASIRGRKGSLAGPRKRV